MQGQPNRPSGPSSRVGETLLIVALVAVAALGALVFAAAQVVALLTGRTNRLGFIDSAGLAVGWVLERAPSSGSTEHAAAHRPTASTLLPASDGVVQVVAVLLGLVAVVAAVAAWSWWRARKGGRSGGFAPGRPARERQAARWAGLWKLRKLLVRPERHPGRLVLGRGPWRRLLAAEAYQSVFVLGPTQSRKTSGFGVPALLEWDGPAIATSVKPDLRMDTVKRRAQLGRVWVFNPAGVGGVPSDGWNPLDAIDSWADAEQMARWLTEAAAEHKEMGDATKGFFDDRGELLIGPAMWAARLDGKDMRQVVRWLYELGAEKPPVTDQEPLPRYNDAAEAILGILGKHDAEDAMVTLKAILDEDPRQRSGSVSTAQRNLKVFADRNVAEACSRSDIDADALLDGSGTLYLYAPLHEQTRLRPLFEALIMFVVRTAMERAAESPGGKLERPFLILLDEAGNIAPLRALDQLASTGAGQGIQLVTMFQDFAQLRHRYGTLAPTVVNNHRAKVILSGLSDPESLEYVSKLIGDAAELEESRTSGEGRDSRTEHTAYRRLAPVSALRETRPGAGVVVYGHLPPIRLRLRTWWKDRTLARLARGGPELWRQDVGAAGAGDGGDGQVVELEEARRRRVVA